MPAVDRINVPPFEQLVEVAANHETFRGLADHVGVNDDTLRNRVQRVDGGMDRIREALRSTGSTGTNGPELPGSYDQSGGGVVLVSDPQGGEPPTPESLLERHDLNPDEWVIARVRTNCWDAMTSDKATGDNRVVRMHQLRVDLVPPSMVIQAPDPGAWTPPPKPRKRKTAQPTKVVICGDHHCPHEDRTLHGLFLEWLADERPDEGVILGDLLDLPSVSRHRRSKGVEPATVNECLEAALRLLQDYRHASPDTRWTLLPGNHDDRLDHYLIDNAAAAYDIKPGGGVDLEGGKTQESLSMRELLFLDDLGIDLIAGDFNRAKHLLGRKLSVRHGYMTGKDAAGKMLGKLRHSVIQGHTHRLRLIYKTEHDDFDEHPTASRVGAEAGCMAEIREGLQYADEPDWQQGLLVAHLWDNDDFTLAPVPYVPGRLLAPSGKRYAA